MQGLPGMGRGSQAFCRPSRNRLARLVWCGVVGVASRDGLPTRLGCRRRRVGMAEMEGRGRSTRPLGDGNGRR